MPKYAVHPNAQYTPPSATSVTINEGTATIGAVTVSSTPGDEAEYSTGVVTGAALDSAATTYTSVVANGSAKGIRVLEVFNDTDGTVEVSFDGGTTVHARLPAGAAVSRDYKANEATETSAVHVREYSTVPVADGYCYVNVVWK